MAHEVEIAIAPVRHLAVAHFHANPDEIPQKIGEAFGAVEAYLRRTGTEMSGPAVTRYVMTGNGFDVAAGFEVASPVEGDGHVVPLDLPAGEVATVTHMGSYDTLPQAYEALQQGVKAQGRQIDEGSPMWEEYWSPPDTPPEQTKTVVYWPVKPR